MGSRGRRSMRVLIVEDDAALALDLRGLVEAFGHEVVGVAETVDEALALSGTALPDVALVDVALAGETDGTEAARVMRERDDVRSLFVTSSTDPSTRDRAQAAWPIGLLPKPVDPARLAAVLAGEAGMRRGRR